MLGQFIINMFVKAGADKENAAFYEMIILIGLSALTTGMGLYSKLAKYGGAGTLVPITGFANSVAASAIEFKKEGHIFGIGTRIFVIAGPVILFGIFTSWVLGLIYWIWKILPI
jgi:stage V sporulation protein AC